MFSINRYARRKQYKIYGHRLDEQQIKKLFPFENKTFDKAKISKNMIVTYNPLLALQLRKQHAPCVIWGQITENDKRVFVFNKKSRAIKSF